VLDRLLASRDSRPGLFADITYDIHIVMYISGGGNASRKVG
jgi:hypothetical protein